MNIHQIDVVFIKISCKSIWPLLSHFPVDCLIIYYSSLFKNNNNSFLSYLCLPVCLFSTNKCIRKCYQLKVLVTNIPLLLSVHRLYIYDHRARINEEILYLTGIFANPNTSLLPCLSEKESK